MEHSKEDYQSESPADPPLFPITVEEEPEQIILPIRENHEPVLVDSI